MMSRLVRLHPGMLSVSEFFTMLSERAFVGDRLTGKEVGERLTRLSPLYAVFVEVGTPVDEGGVPPGTRDPLRRPGGFSADPGGDAAVPHRHSRAPARRASRRGRHARVLTIRFEDLVAGPEDELRRFQRFVGEEFQNPEWVQAAAAIPAPGPFAPETASAGRAGAADRCLRAGTCPVGIRPLTGRAGSRSAPIPAPRRGSGAES